MKQHTPKQTNYVIPLEKNLHIQNYVFPTRWMHIAVSYQFTLPYAHLNMDNSSTNCLTCTAR